VADLTVAQANIEALLIDLQPLDGQLQLRLSDPSFVYETLVRNGTHPLTPGAEVTVSLGYSTASGDRVSEYPHFWINALDVIVERGRRSVIVQAGDVHHLLAAWHPRDAVEYRASRSVFQIIDLTAAKALVDYTTLSSSSNLTALLPDWFHDADFVRWLVKTRPPGWQSVFYKDPATPSRGERPNNLAPGVGRRGVRWDVLERLLTPPLLLGLDNSSDGLNALSRVLSTVRDVSLGQTRQLVTRTVEPSDGSVYSYGDATEHPIRRARYRRRPAEYNHVIASGGIDGQVRRSTIDWTELHAHGKERLVQVADMAADTNTKLDERAQAVLRPSQIGRREDVVEAFPNVGQELWDVVTISDTIAGQVSDELRRVTALRILYEVAGQDADFAMWLTLGDR
jgi:hypothetical protein